MTGKTGCTVNITELGISLKANISLIGNDPMVTFVYDRLCLYGITKDVYHSRTIMRAAAICLGCVFNWFVLYSIWRNKTARKKVPNMLLAHQCCVDCFNIMVYLPIAHGSDYRYLVVLDDPKTFFNWVIVCDVVYEASVISSMASFILMAAERHMAVWKPVQHRLKVNRRKLVQMMAATWILSLAAAIGWGIALAEYLSWYNWYRILLTCTLLVGFLIVSLLTVLTFSRARQTVKQHAVPSNLSSRVKVTNKKSASKEFKLTILFSLLYSSFLLGFLPMSYARVYKHLKEKSDGEINGLVMIVSNIGFILSSICNPLLTMALRRELMPCCLRKNNKVSMTTYYSVSDANPKK